jgi:hypothetical protein
VLQARPLEAINSTTLIRESVKNGIMKSEQYPVGGSMNICFNVLKSKTSRPFESRHRIFRPTVLITAMSERENTAVFKKGVTYLVHKPTANALVTLNERLCIYLNSPLVSPGVVSL